MALLATYFPYLELNNGKSSTPQEFEDGLGKYARSRMFHLCSLMNAMLRSDEDILNWRAHDALVKTFLEPAIVGGMLKNKAM